MRVYLVIFLISQAWYAMGQQPALPQLATIKAAAETGDPKAQDKLGDAYLNRLDKTNALIWYYKAAQKGVPNSEYHAAEILMEQGYDSIFRKVVSSEKVDEALKWYVLAANHRNQRAQIALAQMYETGGQVQKDYPEAYKWYSLAHDVIGLEVVAKVHRDRLILKMNQEQIEEGQKRVEKFLSTPNSSFELPEPAFVNKITLKALSGTAKSRLALINNATLATGEEATIKVDGKPVKVKCLEIKDGSVMVKIDGVEKVKELKLK